MNFKVDLIHLHWQHPFLIAESRSGTIVKSFLFIGQLLMLKILRIKVVWTVHNLKDHDNRHQDLELFFSKFIARHVDVIIAHCQAAKTEIQRVFKADKNKIVVIPHGNFIDIYKNTLPREEARNLLNLSLKDSTFFYMGLLRPYKGLPELIDCFQKLNSVNVKLIIAGKSRDENLLEVLKSKCEGNSNIRLIPRGIPEDEVQIYMKAADIVILPYRDILTSGVCLLGMSFGKAIIAPRLGCMPELLDSSGGFLYDPHEADGLLNAIKEAILSKAKLSEMGNHNRLLANELDWGNIANSTYKIYEACLSSRFTNRSIKDLLKHW